jgi:hypothetical protein
MNDRQRLETIVAVVCKYLPPDGISREDVMREIIGLVDPLPEQEPRKEWVGLTDEDINKAFSGAATWLELIRIIEAKLKEKNT